MSQMMQKIRLYWIVSLVILFFHSVDSKRTNLRNPFTIIEKKNNSEPRPVIYTFFTLKREKFGPNLDRNIHEALLDVWVKLWTEAGWEPRILTLEDAKKHPDFDKYSKAVASIDRLFDGSYNYLCFMRWLAMAAHGNGGWMSDYDVFPMGITTEPGITLPNSGSFTCWDIYIPSLLSGNNDEWNRMTLILLDFVIEDSQKASRSIKKRISDMNGLRAINAENPDTFIHEQKVFQGFPYYEEKYRMACYTLSKSKIYAVHLSHVGTAHAIEHGLVNYSGGNVIENVERVRPKLALELDENWRKQCLVT